MFEVMLIRSYRINICKLGWLLIIAIPEPSTLRKNSAHYFIPKFKILYTWKFCKDFSSLGQKIQLKQPIFVLFLRHSTARILRQSTFCTYTHIHVVRHSSVLTVSIPEYKQDQIYSFSIYCYNSRVARYNKRTSYSS